VCAHEYRHGMCFRASSVFVLSGDTEQSRLESIKVD
jgi:hypothetical protein